MLVYQRVLENHTGSIILKNEEIYIYSNIWQIYGKYWDNNWDSNMGSYWENNNGIINRRIMAFFLL